MYSYLKTEEIKKIMIPIKNIYLKVKIPKSSLLSYHGYHDNLGKANGYCELLVCTINLII